MNQQKVLLMTVFYVFSVACSKFPLKDIFHLSQDAKIPKENYLCSADIKTRYKNDKCCKCTKDCMKYKTCCIDRLWNSTRPVPFQEYLNLFMNAASQYKDTTCELAFPAIDKNVQNNTSENILMVSTCLKHASHLDKQGCKHSIGTSYESIMPVFGSDQYIYKNSFCARCNFVKHYQLLNLTAKCTAQEESEHENPYPKFMNCFFKVSRTKTIKSFVKTCNRNIFDRRSACNKENNYYKLCSSYLGVVGNSANYHCFMCNNTNTGNFAVNLPSSACPNYVATDDEDDEDDADDEDDEDDDEDDEDDENDDDDDVDGEDGEDVGDIKENPDIPRKLQWSCTISFAEETNIVIQRTKRSSMKFCNNGKIYNIISSKCERFFCSRGYKKTVNGCFEYKDRLQNPVIVVHNATFDKCLIESNVTMIVVINPSEENRLAPNEVLSNLLNTSLASSIINIETNESSKYQRVSLNISQDQLILIKKILTSSKYLNGAAIEKVYLTSLPAKDLKNRLQTDFTKDFKGGRSCAEAVTVSNISNNFMENCSYILQNNILDISNTSFLVEIDRASWKRKLISCSAFYLHSSCPLKQITNYTLFENKTLKVGNNLYHTSQYVPLNNSFGICIPTHGKNGLFSSYKWHGNLSKCLEYISISGTIVSIVCYSVIIIVYRFIKTIKRLPSAAIVLQCVTLLVVDTTFIVAFHMHRHAFGCKLIAVILHWGLLAAQLWTAIIAIDLSSKIHSVSVTIAKTNSTRLVAYCIAAYIIPTIIVSTAFLLDMHHIIDVSYGGNDICFINDFYSKLHFYCIPLAAIYFITISLLVYTLYCIWKRENEARKVLKKSGRRNSNLLAIAFKLILALGLIEILGFTQISKKNLSENELIFNSVFAALYTILRSLRGLWLFMIYVCNQRKMKILRSAWRNNALRPNEMRLS